VSSNTNNAVMDFAHRENIRRYQRLLKTHLTDHERRFVERRIREEKAALSQVEQI